MKIKFNFQANKANKFQKGSTKSFTFFKHFTSCSHINKIYGRNLSNFLTLKIFIFITDPKKLALDKMKKLTVMKFETALT